jgi:hypothetical protein
VILAVLKSLAKALMREKKVTLLRSRWCPMCFRVIFGSIQVNLLKIRSKTKLKVKKKMTKTTMPGRKRERKSKRRKLRY